MTTAFDDRSVLAALRDLVPARPLRYDEALQVADQQAVRLLRLAGVTEPPVPSEIISELPRIRVRLAAELPVAGTAHWSDGHWIVTLASGDHPRRRRFSLAHEFKHVLDHPYRPFLYSRLNSTYQQAQIELVADAFAAALLMPKVMVRRAFTAGIQDPHDLARIFDVSPAAMRIRLRQLGLNKTQAGCGTTWRRGYRDQRSEGARV